MWSQQQENKGRRKAESVINGAKDGAKDGTFRHAAGGGGVWLRGRRCWACWVRRQVWEYSHRGILAERQPARNCSKSQSVDLFSYHGRNGGMQVRVGSSYPLSQDQKKPLDWKGISFCSAQQDMATGVTGQVLCQQTRLQRSGQP